MLCVKCKTDKDPETEFYKNDKTCKKCRYERAKEWRRETGRTSYTRDIPKQDLKDQKFGMLIPKESYFLIKKDGAKQAVWKCLCDCGEYKDVRATDLINGKTKSCGCYIREVLPDVNRGKRKRSDTGRKSNCWRGYGEISGQFFKRIEHNAKNRSKDIEFKINIEDIWEKYLEQNRLCVLTGLPIKFAETKGAENTASLDRIDSSKGYTKENIQWVHKDVNKMKQDLSDERLFELCKLVVANRNSV